MNLKLKTYPHWLSLTVLAIGISLRFIYLDADPQYYDWVGYITDEGRWVQHARSLSLFGGLFDHNLYMHFYLAPFYQLANYLVFKVAGVSLLSSRLLSAFCGSALLVLVWARLRHIVSPQALLLGVTLLALQLDLLALSRVAVPEMAAMFFQALIYFVIVMRGSSVWRFALAGFLMFMAVGVKATTVLVLPIFSVVILLMPRYPEQTGNLARSDIILDGVSATRRAFHCSLDFRPAGAKRRSSVPSCRFLEICIYRVYCGFQVFTV